MRYGCSQGEVWLRYRVGVANVEVGYGQGREIQGWVWLVCTTVCVCAVSSSEP